MDETKAIARNRTLEWKLGKHLYRCYFWEHEIASDELLDQCPICGHPVQEIDPTTKKKLPPK